MLPLILTSLFVVICVVYIALNVRLARMLRRMERARAQAASVADAVTIGPNPPTITVLVAARDEEANLPRTLEALLAQDWPRERLQIVIVDDRSADRTPEILRHYAARYPGLIDMMRVTQDPVGISPKKNALSLGLTIARGEWIAVTDADCLMEPGWLRGLARSFGSEVIEGAKVGMVFGITSYDEPLDGFTPVQGARALEFISYGVATAGLAGFGFPVSANANNIAYRREAFESIGGYARHGTIVSGDDDFTLQELHAAGWDFRFCADREARVRTQAPATWSEFWEQRKRWAGKTIHYRGPQVAFLSLIYGFYLSTLCLLLAGLLRLGPSYLGLLGLAGIGSKALGEYLNMSAGLRLFGLSPLLRFFPLTSALHLPLTVAAVPAGIIRGFTWKGQKMGRKV